jgi:predicted Zn finger-like uncharacterized protein
VNSDEDAEMNVTCPNCATIYRVDPGKVPAGGVRARCAVCSAIFAVGDGAQAPVAEPAAAAITGSWSAPEPEAPAPVEAAPSTLVIPEPAPPEPEPEPEPEPVAPPAPAPPVLAEPPRPATTMPPAVAAPRPVSAPPRTPVSTMPRPAGMPPRPAGVPPARPTETPRRAVNPFLSQDPSQKARRLARALISDMVVYHPAKRREGLRDGNLKTLFDEEIKKSWEEYVEQVGQDIADGTAHFREALNEILADGRQIF